MISSKANTADQINPSTMQVAEIAISGWSCGGLLREGQYGEIG
jgi:hypothetical protein